MQTLQSKLTLVLLLVVLVSQLFPTCVAADIHFSEQSKSMQLIATELEAECCHQQTHSCEHSAEFDNDFHTSCHPPVEHSFAAEFNRIDGISHYDTRYKNRSDAPPIPPPYA